MKNKLTILLLLILPYIGFSQIDDSNIQDAVNLWVSDQQAAISTYGNISEWDNYDKHCKRSTIHLPENMINHMYQLTNLKYPIEIENTEIKVTITCPNNIPEIIKIGEPKPSKVTQITEKIKK